MSPENRRAVRRSPFTGARHQIRGLTAKIARNSDLTSHAARSAVFLAVHERFYFPAGLTEAQREQLADNVWALIQTIAAETN